jgi:hypothetical protein
MRRVSQDGSGLAGIAIDEDECGTLDAVVPFPIACARRKKLHFCMISDPFPCWNAFLFY